MFVVGIELLSGNTTTEESPKDRDSYSSMNSILALKHNTTIPAAVILCVGLRSDIIGKYSF